MTDSELKIVILCSSKQSCWLNVDLNCGNTNLNENIIVAVVIIAIHLKPIQLVSRSHPLPFSWKTNDSFQNVLSWLNLCNILSFFHAMEATTMSVPRIIIKLSFKMSRYTLIEVYTKLLLAAIKLFRFSYQQSKWISLTDKPFRSLKSKQQKLITYVVWFEVIRGENTLDR